MPFIDEIRELSHRRSNSAVPSDDRIAVLRRQDDQGELLDL